MPAAIKAAGRRPTMNQATDLWAKHWALASAAGIGAATVEAEQYVSPEVFAAERDRIFRRVWLLVGRETEVPAPGDFIRREIPPLKTEALIVRGKDGRIRAFHNACPHRGSALVRETDGTRNTFVCPYHGWSFAADGACIAIAAAEFFPDLDRTKVGLAPIHAETWNGFVFLNFDAEPEQSLADYLGAFGTLYGEVPFHEFRHCVQAVRDIETNWKCLLDAFNESYHVSVLHRRTLPQVPTPTNPHGVYYDGQFLGPHSSFITQGNPDWAPGGDVARFVYGGLAHARLRPPAIGNDISGPRILADHKGVNPLGLPIFALRLLNIFPFSQLQLFSDSYNLLQYWPIGVGRTRFVLRRYTRSAPASYFEAFAEEHVWVSSYDVLTEDVAMTERQQASLESGALKQMHFGEHEPFVRYFHQAVEDYLAGHPPVA
jgi:phenylpropionate dioxygenase-like ring-hydroxylating dioxygenase large terminal subunit